MTNGDAKILLQENVARVVAGESFTPSVEAQAYGGQPGATTHPKPYRITPEILSLA